MFIYIYMSIFPLKNISYVSYYIIFKDTKFDKFLLNTKLKLKLELQKSH